ncbi:Imm1 family immunity protein [Deinococcus cellulosilyticus]|uniref:Uncharacterized protein n=1 Tax=Deinococcus cellulosilyticus (strain DSM 18568 / NBRC 106333 / KACC 11606 / 5516J-15) TaxID=1223518 RepID=A0A511N8U8_DEIC1|nr:Imm1 family immunity protein [Deinococcus cellulosilyticus]GEM49254.1 hypothetical protein DC3_48890 [Deinococcus cellulosilyticus NBRC 106333 = KACC 11606]
MTPVGTVVWQGIAQALQVTSRADLMQAIEQARKAARHQGVPLSVELRIDNSGVMSILVGADRSYLVFKPENGHFCHVADDVHAGNTRPGKCLAFIEDGHLSEIDLRLTVPFELAQEALLSFAETGEIPRSLPWMSA